MAMISAMRHTPVLLFVFALISGFAYSATHRPSQQHDFALGVHLLFTGSAGEYPASTLGWGEHLRYARYLTGEGGWVVQLIKETDMNPGKWQHFLDICFRLRLRPIFRLATTDDRENRYWTVPPRDPDGDFQVIAAAWQDFFAALDYQQPVWVVVGNEPNNGAEWGGQPDPAAYAGYYRAIAARLSALDAPLYLSPAALDTYVPHTGDFPFPGTSLYMMDAAAFWDGMFAAEPDIMPYTDFWAVHVYPLGAFYRPPWEQTYRVDRFQGAERLPLRQPPSAIPNRGVNGYRWQVWYLQNVIRADVPPLLITEFGYRHSNPYTALSSDSGGAEIDSRTAAVYLDLALFGNNGRYPDLPNDGWTPLAQDPAIMGVVLFALAGTPDAWSHTNLLVSDASGRILETYPHYDLLVLSDEK